MEPKPGTPAAAGTRSPRVHGGCQHHRRRFGGAASRFRRRPVDRRRCCRRRDSARCRRRGSGHRCHGQTRSGPDRWHGLAGRSRSGQGPAAPMGSSAGACHQRRCARRDGNAPSSGWSRPTRRALKFGADGRDPRLRAAASGERQADQTGRPPTAHPLGWTASLLWVQLSRASAAINVRTMATTSKK